MSGTNNLGRPVLTPNQANAGTTANDSMGIIDAALTEILTADVSSADVTFVGNEDNYKRAIKLVLVNSGNTAGRKVTLAQVKSFKVVENPTGVAISVVRGTSTFSIGVGKAVCLYTDGTANGLTIISGGSSGGNAIAVKDEGTQITASVQSLNFVGAGVTATDDGAGNTTVTIPGSTGGGGTTITPPAFAKFNPPAVAAFPTIVDTPSAPGGCTLTNVPHVGTIFDYGPCPGADKPRCAMKSITGWTAPWSVKARLRPNIPESTYVATGIFMRETSSGKLAFFGPNWTNPVVMTCGRYTSLTAWSGASFTMNQYMPTDFWRVDCDGTNLLYYISYDGYTWRKVFQEAKNAFFASGPDQIGFGLSGNTSPPATADSHIYITCLWWTDPDIADASGW